MATARVHCATARIGQYRNVKPPEGAQVRVGVRSAGGISKARYRNKTGDVRNKYDIRGRTISRSIGMRPIRSNGRQRMGKGRSGGHAV